ncbi:MAG: SNF1-interacting protein, partial [Thelocarpon impressellum]
MGNSSTKEQRAPAPQLHATTAAIHHHHHRHRNSPPLSPHARPGEQPPPSVGQGRGGSRPELAFVVGGVPDPDAAGLELRRETKQERDARRAERDRVAREKERVRSMRDESVDGGYLVTQGVYTGSEDFDKAVVRQLMIERRVAPFFKGLNEHSGSWTDQQLVAASRGLPIPAAGEDVPGPSASLPLASEPGSDALAIPIVPSPTSHASWSPVTSNFASSQPLPVATPPPLPSSSSPFRPRSKTVATLTSLSRHGSQADITPSEVHLSPPPQLDGRPVAAFLYRDASECPICFLYYPPYLNKTRCCDQPICSECFVQIKRPDPHPPEHADPASAAAAAGAPPRAEPDGTLVSEPAGCPFCVQPQFGITYEPPPFRSGLAYANQAQPHLMARTGSGMSTSSSVSDGSAGALSPGLGARRRTTSLSANDGSVITTDRIRPDWAHRLANAKAQAARRSAAATALHTAAYLMGTGGAGAGEGRGFAGFGRRNRLAHARAAA